MNERTALRHLPVLMGSPSHTQVHEHLRQRPHVY